MNIVFWPFSLTSCLVKLAERLIKTWLTSFVEENNLIVKHQAGFRRLRQTKFNLVHLIQKSKESFNRKKKVCAIFFDIASAFDKIWHDGFIFKLIKMGIPDYIIIWCLIFLQNRFFKVKMNDFVSECYLITAEVPQGAVLSPILFAIFSNDIPHKLNKNSEYS